MRVSKLPPPYEIARSANYITSAKSEPVISRLSRVVTSQRVVPTLQTGCGLRREHAMNRGRPDGRPLNLDNSRQTRWP